MASLRLPGLLLSLLAASAPSWALLDCKRVLVDGHTFNLGSLGGPHSVVTSHFSGDYDTHINTTYTVDICQPLKKTSKGKGQCPNGTRVCAIEHLIKEDTDDILDTIAIAGNLETQGGKQFEYELTRLSTSDSNDDSKKEGVRIVLKGGRHPLVGNRKDRRDQKAVIEFLCDPTKDGTEGEWDSEDKYESRALQRREEESDDKGDDKGDGEDGKDGKDGKDGGDDEGEDDGEDDDNGDSSVEHQLRNDGAALIWESYGKKDDKTDALHLTWHTKHACEKRDDNGDDNGKDPSDGNDADGTNSWGFFTWFIIIAFLGIAAYLIFGSWLNYNRYGARGWDLLPHGDTIREVPYLFQDWIRRVLNTVQGAGSRGGYSAV